MASGTLGRQVVRTSWPESVAHQRDEASMEWLSAGAKQRQVDELTEVASCFLRRLEMEIRVEGDLAATMDRSA